MSVANNKRSTDGLTINKIVASVAGTALLTLASIQMNLNLSTNKQVDDNGKQVVVIIEHLKNTDSMIAINRQEIKDQRKELEKEREENRKFRNLAMDWYKENKPSYRSSQ